MVDVLSNENGVAKNLLILAHDTKQSLVDAVEQEIGNTNDLNWGDKIGMKYLWNGLWKNWGEVKERKGKTDRIWRENDQNLLLKRFKKKNDGRFHEGQQSFNHEKKTAEDIFGNRGERKCGSCGGSKIVGQWVYSCCSYWRKNIGKWW